MKVLHNKSRKSVHIHELEVVRYAMSQTEEKNSCIFISLKDTLALV